MRPCDAIERDAAARAVELKGETASGQHTYADECICEIRYIVNFVKEECVAIDDNLSSAVSHGGFGAHPLKGGG